MKGFGKHDDWLNWLIRAIYNSLLFHSFLPDGDFKEYLRHCNIRRRLADRIAQVVVSERVIGGSPRTS
jgi:hypothetical protein